MDYDVLYDVRKMVIIVVLNVVLFSYFGTRRLSHNDNSTFDKFTMFASLSTKEESLCILVDSGRHIFCSLSMTSDRNNCL
jgi:hypothetical protein